jgi:tRNA-uridine 2-sulfurtransferase
VRTVFIAMSGGIDSSYSAYLLTQQGYKVVGFTFDLLPQSLKNECNSKTCCSASATERARSIATRLGIPHYVMNMRDDFERYVIQPFIDEYRVGRTPNPCVLCNEYVKFGSFLKKAFAMGADKVATGHYAQLEESDKGVELRKGMDETKDQSYFLYSIKKDDLRHILFPLAQSLKKDVRSGFGEYNNAGERVKESQDICFIPDGNYKSFVGQLIPARRGAIETLDGRTLGFHYGIHNFTIGQRRGLNIPYGEPLYVVALRPEDNAVVVGPRESVERKGLAAERVNMLTTATAGKAAARVRYRQKEQPCFYRVEDGTLTISFDDPVSSITPGQSVVLYEGDRVLGGGMIKDAFPAGFDALNPPTIP